MGSLEGLQSAGFFLGAVWLIVHFCGGWSHGGVAFSGECALVHSSSSSRRGAPQCGLTVSTSLGQRCEHRGWEVLSPVQRRMVIGLS